MFAIVSLSYAFLIQICMDLVGWILKNRKREEISSFEVLDVLF
jgi:hypothetical protein